MKLSISSGVVPYYFYRRKVGMFYTQNYLINKKKQSVHPEKLVSYGGHYGVTRSLIDGLNKLDNISFNYNPGSLSKIYDTLLVIGGGEKPVRQGIELKRKGKIKKLVVGPNVAVWPYEDLASSEIDLLLTPSKWPGEFWADVDKNIDREKLRSWPAGIDEQFWNPEKSNDKTGNKILFYKKRAIESQYNNCKKIAEQNGFEVVELIPGTYNFDSYKQLLKEVDFLVHFVEQESQGLSTLESWAMDVPTIVWNPGYWHFNMKNFSSSSAPYLTPETGAFFRDEGAFDKLLNDGAFNKTLYSPRKWVLKNMTDKICAQNLLDIIFENSIIK